MVPVAGAFLGTVILSALKRDYLSEACRRLSSSEVGCFEDGSCRLEDSIRRESYSLFGGGRTSAIVSHIDGQRSGAEIPGSRADSRRASTGHGDDARAFQSVRLDDCA